VSVAIILLELLSQLQYRDPRTHQSDRDCYRDGMPQPEWSSRHNRWITLGLSVPVLKSLPQPPQMPYSRRNGHQSKNGQNDAKPRQLVVELPRRLAVGSSCRDLQHRCISGKQESLSTDRPPIAHTDELIFVLYLFSVSVITFPLCNNQTGPPVQTAAFRPTA